MQRKKITGKRDDVSLYRMSGRYYVRLAGGPSPTEMLSSKKFTSQRDHSNEFAKCSKLGKKFRDLLKPEKNSMDNGAYKKLTGILCEIKNEDYVNERGKRSAGYGILSDKGKQLLRNFLFNPEAGKKIKGLSVFVTEDGKIKIPRGQRFIFPKGTDHVIIKAIAIQFNFMTGVGSRINYEEVKLIKHTIDDPIILQPINPEVKQQGMCVYLLHAAFYKPLRERLNAGKKDHLVIFDVREEKQPTPIRSMPRIITQVGPVTQNQHVSLRALR